MRSRAHRGGAAQLAVLPRPPRRRLRQRHRALPRQRRAAAVRRATGKAPSGATTTPFAEGFAMPAEWEPHAATFLAWPHEKSDWPGKFEMIPWVFAELARLITRSERVRLIVRNAADKKHAKAVLTSAGVDLKLVDFIT